jgi:hypothetical protein
MQEVIDRLWNAINSKLPRVVNSVNNRTGAVVLNPGDVGLGNVDDVSFNDIKNWVIEYFSTKMSKYRFKLYNTLAEMQTEAATNERSLDSVPFYVKSGTDVSDPTGNKLAYIGYFYWDDNTSTIEVSIKEINVVGATDKSLNYDQGHLSVNIYPDEDNPLYLDNGEEDPTKTGLRVDTSKLASEMLSSPCIYGDETGDALLAATVYAKSTPPIEVRVFIDGTQITESNPFYLHKNWVDKLKMFTQVLTEFKGLYNGEYSSSTPPIPIGISSLVLMDRQPAIGVVTHVPDTSDPAYEIKFNTIKAFTSGMGLRYVENHLTRIPGEQLAVDMYVSSIGGLSGLAAKATGLLPKDASATQGLQSDLQNLAYRPTTPYGDNRLGTEQNLYPYQGLIVATDDTICRYPVHKFNPSGKTHQVTEDGDSINEYIGSECAENWSPIAYYGFKENQRYTGKQDPDGINNGYLTSTSYLSVNMNKLVRDANYEILTEHEAPTDWDNPNVDFYYVKSIGHDDYVYEKIGAVRPPYTRGAYARKTTQRKFHFTNLSGLKSTHVNIDRTNPDPSAQRYSELTEDELKSLGIFDRKDSLGNEVQLYPFNNFSGGVSVNVGNFLEICPKETAYGNEYDDSGKVNVRIGKGLIDDCNIDPDPIDLSPYAASRPVPGFVEHPEMFVLKKGDMYYNTPAYAFYIMHEQPNDWETNYTNYFYRMQDDQIERYIQFQPDSEAPDFDYYETNGGVYVLGGPWMNVYVSILTGIYSSLHRKIRKNRIAVNVDNITTKINDNNEVVLKSSVVRQFGPYERYTVGELIYVGPTAKRRLARVQRDFYSEPQKTEMDYFRSGELSWITRIPDDETIVGNADGTMNARTMVRIYDTQTTYYRNEIVKDVDTNRLAYVTVSDSDSFDSGTDSFDDWLNHGFLSLLTYRPDNKTIYTDSSGTIGVDALIAKKYSGGMTIYKGQLFTDKQYKGFYMWIDNNGQTSSGSQDDDVNLQTDINNNRVLVIKSPT